MATFEEVRGLVGEVLELGARTERLKPATPLLGAMPEFDSMAVVSIITAIEERYGVTINDDEISADTFENLGNLFAFVKDKVDHRDQG